MIRLVMTHSQFRIFVFSCLIAVMPAYLLTGCSGSSQNGDDGGNEWTPPEETGESPVLMMGRSTMAGWFSHWGVDTSETVTFDDHTLYYGALETPPDIADTACDYINSLSSDEAWIVFFKLCFEDFEGWSRSDAEANLEANKSYVLQVIDCAAENGRRLIIGNALPKIDAETTSDLVWNHEQYNAWLEDLAGDNGDITIVDLYGVLADSDGSLKAAYATDPSDSHPNDDAYEALDPVLAGAL